MLHRAARNAYSWWWASHVRTKQSKWLEQNLQDMEEKVEYILEVLEQEGESFSQRAEMYYRRRPEVVNFVEDSFQGYIALAARYDRLSRELQSANQTIATVYPEQVQLAIDDEDEENFPSTSTPSSDHIKPPKILPAAPKLNIPKNPKIPHKNSKAPARLMSKKGLIKMNVPTTAAERPLEMRKAEALKEIDELQKNILGLQIEKEFVKGLHERGLEKYWEIEGEITEMQGKVNSLQNEFGIGMVIEDDEAQTLMTATALKLCQETLTRLQEKQQQSDEETRKEHQRIKEAHKKLEILKEKFGSWKKKTDLPESLEFVSTSMEAELDQGVNRVEQETHELELLKTKIKEQLKTDYTASLTMSRLVEKIDDLVDKVITLETAVSCQNALVKRLRSETNTLQGHLQNLEEEKEALIGGSDDKSNRIRELEIELLRIQNLKHNVRDKNRHLQIHFTEASCSVAHLSEKLHAVKLDEEVDHIPLFEDSGAIPGVALGKDFLVDEDLISPDNNSKIIKGIKPEGKGEIDVLKKSDTENIRMGEEANKDKIADPSTSIRTENENFAQFKTSSPADNILVPIEVREVPNADPEGSFKENEGNVALGYNSVNLKNVRMEREVKKDNVPDESCSTKAKENFVQPELSNCFGDLWLEVQATSVDNLAKGLDEHEDIIAPIHEKMVTEDVRMSERDNTGGYPDHHHDDKAEKENSFQLNPCNLLEDLLVNGQVRGVLGTNSEGSKEHEDMPPANDLVISADVKTEKEEKKHNQELGASAKAEEDNIVQSRRSNLFDDLPRRSQVRPAQDVVPERIVKQRKGVIRLTNGSMISRDMIMDQRENCKSFNYDAVRGENDQSNISNQLNSLLQEIQAEAVPHANPEKGFKEHKNVSASGNNSLISTGAKTRKEKTKDDTPNCSTPMKAKKEENYIQSNSSTHLNQKDQEPKKQNREPGNEDEEDQPNWRQLFFKGLDDRGKILLQNYILIVKNYKAAKIKSATQIKELKHANALKDAKIQSLYKKLNLLQIWLDEALVTTLADFTHSQQGGSQRSTARAESDKKQVSDLPGEQKVEPLERKEESTAQQERAINFPRKGRKKRAVSSVDDERRAISKIEGRLREDIDGLLEENIELWLRFSTSLHQIRKFRTSVQDLLGELTKIRESKKQEGSTKSQPLDSDVRPIYKHLREIQTELALWLEHNALLEDDSKNRLSALESILEEISRLSNGAGGLKEEEEEEESFLSDFQAATFRGEVMNMKQENNKVAEKLMVGLQQVKELQIEITTTLVKLEEELGISVPRNRRTASSGSRSPMRSFLLRLRNRSHHSSNGRFEHGKSNISTQIHFH